MSAAESNARSPERLAAEPLEVLVIGGGIVGAGVARDAAMRGLRVGLVEQHDFASGTSSRSTRLLHGGLRYLAQGHLRLVRESSVEKRIVARIAPHLAEAYPLVLPTRRGTPWPLWKLRLGVKLYDLMCGGRNFGRSRSLRVPQLLDLLPGLNPDGLTGGVRYFDAMSNDARLVLDTLRSAARHGALVANYCRFEDARREGDGWLCSVADGLAGRSLAVRTRCVVNAAGPWADRIPHSAVRLHVTKGVHLVLDRARLPVAEGVMIPEGERLLFALPWGERVVLGSTDTDYHGDLDDPRCEPEDAAYVLGILNRAFPGARLTEADILSTWAGLRPLLADRHGRPSDISRAHRIRQAEPGWWDAAGGKLTIYRLMGEETVDQIVRHLGRRTPPCRTAAEPLVAPEEAAGVSGVLPPPVTQAAVEHYCRREWAVRLDDVMVRRTLWHVYRTDRAAVAEQVADWMAAALGWDSARRGEELRAYRAMCG